MSLRLPTDLDRQRLAMRQPPEWTGDLADDCTAIWGSFLLRAEQMDRDVWWWWCVYDTSGEKASSNYDRHVSRTGRTARAAAESAARRVVGLPASGVP